MIAFAPRSDFLDDLAWRLGALKPGQLFKCDNCDSVYLKLLDALDQPKQMCNIVCMETWMPMRLHEDSIVIRIGTLYWSE